MRKLWGIGVVLLLVQGCASHLTCDEQCAMSGMICTGQIRGQSSGAAITSTGQVVTTSGTSVSAVCSKPTKPEEEQQVNEYRPSAQRKEREAKENSEIAWTAGIVAFLGAIVGVLSFY